MESVANYSEARNEYMKQLSTWVVPFMIQHYRNLWNGAAKSGSQKAMLIFQEKCAEVPKWNQDTIDENVGKLLDNCRCDYLEELMAAVFIAHTKVLIAIRVSSKHKKLQITLPKLDHFLHRIFSECARSFWKIPYLFLDEQKPIEMQKNMLQAEVLCSEAINAAVRSLLPIKNILAEYLSDDVMNPEPTIEEEDVESKKLPVEQALSPIPISAEPETLASTATEVKPEALAEAVVADAVVADTVVADAVVADAVVADAVVADAVVADAVVADAVVAEPVVADAVVADAVVADAVVADAVVADANTKVEPKSPKKTQDLVSSLGKITTLEDIKPVQIKQTGGEPEEIRIDTEPLAVNFSNYDQVFDESTESVGSFKYVPKDLEPGEVPRLIINEAQEMSLSLDSSVTPLEAPGVESGVLADSILD